VSKQELKLVDAAEEGSVKTFKEIFKGIMTHNAKVGIKALTSKVAQSI